MCGIVAIHDPEGGVDPLAIARALHAMKHRGPDGRGTWISADRKVGIGHARLAVIDPRGGAQPIASEDTDIIASVNGEFYGFAEIRAELTARVHRFRTGSDSEILVHLYQELGPDCLARLRGEFAFVLWDRKRGRLFAARDRFGIKPLVYAKDGARVVLASEAGALFAAGIRAAWDRDSFFQAMHLQYTAPDRTLFAGVHQLEPGCFLTIEGDRLEIRRYWDLDLVREDDLVRRDEAEQIAEVRRALETSIELRMIVDVPVAVQLSGGLDSSAIAGIAASKQRKPIECFTVSFDAPEYDELAIAEETTRRLGAALHTVVAREADLIEVLPRAVIAAESLAVNAHLPAKVLLSRAVHDAGFKVILSGEGSDEVFAGYPHFRLDLIANDPLAQAQLTKENRVSAGVLMPSGDALDTRAVSDALGFVPGFLKAKATLGRKNRALLTRDFLEEFTGRDVYRELIDRTDVIGQLRGRHPVHQSIYLWAKLALPAYLLRVMGDGAEMASSIEGRLPYLDHHLFDVLRRVPVDLKIKDGVEKHILREATKDRITNTVYRRKKHPFFAPPLRAVKEILESGTFDAVPFYDHARVRALLRSADPDAVKDADPILVMAASAAILQQHFRL